MAMNDIPQREYFEKLLIEIEHKIDLRFDSLDKALSLQAREYERRLEILNNEQSRLAAERLHFLPREVYERDTKWGIGLIVTLVGVVTAILLYFK
jgi:uncharacterized membrane protein YukC